MSPASAHVIFYALAQPTDALPKGVMSMLLLSDEANRVVSQHKKQGVFTVTNCHAGTERRPARTF
jgi:hypothetical protein